MPAQGRGPAGLVAWPMPLVAAVAAVGEAGRGAARAAAVVEGVVVAAVGVVDGVAVAAVAATAPVAVARAAGVVRAAVARAAGRADAKGSSAPNAGLCLTLCVCPPAPSTSAPTPTNYENPTPRGPPEANLTAYRFAPSESDSSRAFSRRKKAQG